MSKKAEAELKLLRDDILITAPRVSEFVNENWQGVYTSFQAAKNEDGETWVTLLHGPGGPKVFTWVANDGTMTDITNITKVS